MVNIDYDSREYFNQGLWGELQQSISSNPPIEYMIDSLDTEQTEDDTLSSKPIGPELDDSEQLTGESIQPYLTLEGQLQYLVTLGRFGIHAQVTSMSRFSSAPRKLKRIYGYVKKTINFH